MRYIDQGGQRYVGSGKWRQTGHPDEQTDIWTEIWTHGHMDRHSSIQIHRQKAILVKARVLGGKFKIFRIFRIFSRKFQIIDYHSE